MHGNWGALSHQTLRQTPTGVSFFVVQNATSDSRGRRRDICMYSESLWVFRVRIRAGSRACLPKNFTGGNRLRMYMLA